MLPIPLTLDQLPSQWRSLETQLVSLAKQEREQYEYASDRLVLNSLAMAQWYASKRNWQALHKHLSDRNILTDKAIVLASKPKPSKPKPSTGALIRLFTAQCMAEVLAIPKLIHAPLHSYLLLDFLLYLAHLGKTYKLTPLFFQLTHYEKGKSIYKDKKYLQIRSKVKIGRNVRDMLLLFSKKYKEKVRCERTPLSTIEKKKLLDKVFKQIITDKWQDTQSIHTRFTKLCDVPMDKYRLDDRLEYRRSLGEIFYYKPAKGNSAYYSNNPNATEFESEWMDVARAYDIAVKNGCKAAFNTFRTKMWKTDYTKEGILQYYRQYGLDFRFEVPADENYVFKWRLLP
jgi:hypothetical protein